MTEEISYIPEPPETFGEAPEKKKKKTLWIILGVVILILLCCCLIGVLAWVLGFSLDEYDQLFYLLPYLSLG